MHIVVNDIYFKGYHPHGNTFVQHLFALLIEKHPEHHFYFLVNKFDKSAYPEANNASVITINSSIANIATLKLWDLIQLPRLLKQLKATILIQPNGLYAYTKVPQLLVITDILWLQTQSSIPSYIRWYHRLVINKSVSKSSQIVTLTEKIRQEMLSNFPNASGKVSIVNAAHSSLFHPIDYDNKREVKATYTEGKEFFLYNRIIHQDKTIIELLKAFALFKRWQKSNMKLLIVGAIADNKNGILSKLSSYKYKDDVMIMHTISNQQLAQITAAAYAVIHPYDLDPYTSPILSSMNCGVSTITICDGTIDEIGGDASLYALPNDTNSLANALKLIYKDELFGRSITKKGLEQSEHFNWNNASISFWKVLMHTVTI